MLQGGAGVALLVERLATVCKVCGSNSGGRDTFLAHPDAAFYKTGNGSLSRGGKEAEAWP